MKNIYKANERTVNRKKWWLYSLFVIIFPISFALTACAPQPATSTQEEVKNSLPLPTPTQNRTDDAFIRSYHALLMLERAQDLMLAVIEKINDGKIARNDSSAIATYVNAFPVAVDSINQANPPAEMEDIWNHVFQAVQQYNQAYTLIELVVPISPENTTRLTETHKLLAIDQSMVEEYLIQEGLDQDYFSMQQEAVDRHFQQVYGDQQVPSYMP